MWQGFLKKNHIKAQPLQHIVNEITLFLMPPCLAVVQDDSFEKLWFPDLSQWN